MINQGIGFLQSHRCNKKRWRLWFPDFWGLQRTLVRAGMQGGGGTGAATIPESHFVIESSTSGEFSEHVTEAWNWQTIVGDSDCQPMPGVPGISDLMLLRSCGVT